MDIVITVGIQNINIYISFYIYTQTPIHIYILLLLPPHTHSYSTMFKRSFHSSIQQLQEHLLPKIVNNSTITTPSPQIDLLKKYYGSPRILESIKLAQTVLPPEWESIKLQNNKAGNTDGGDLLKLNPLYDNISTNMDLNTKSHIAKSYYPDYFHLNALQNRVSKTITMANNIYMQTQIDPRYITKRLEMRPLVLKRVSNQTAKGKIRSHYALCVVGDRNGMVGLGEGKSRGDMGKAISKAHWDAIRNLVFVNRFEDRTVYGDIEYRYHGVKLFIRQKGAGSGLRVHHTIFEICQLAGIKDLTVKVYKSRNDMNVAKGFLEAVTMGQTPLRQLALGRGKKIVDVRKVYYSE